MSIQDDIFDVGHALEGMPEAEQFNRVCEHFGSVEAKLQIYKKIVDDIGTGVNGFKAAMRILDMDL